MENFSEIIEVLEKVPLFVYLIFGFLALIFIFGKSVEWEYEADLVEEESFVLQGELEFKKYKKEPPFAEFEIRKEYKTEFKNKNIKFYINDRIFFELSLDSQGIPIDKSMAKKVKSKSIKAQERAYDYGTIYFPVPINFKPNSGDDILVTINDNKSLRGKLLNERPKSEKTTTKN